MGHRRISNKRVKQMLEEVLPDDFGGEDAMKDQNEASDQPFETDKDETNE